MRMKLCLLFYLMIRIRIYPLSYLLLEVLLLQKRSQAWPVYRLSSLLQVLQMRMEKDLLLRVYHLSYLLLGVLQRRKEMDLSFSLLQDLLLRVYHLSYLLQELQRRMRVYPLSYLLQGVAQRRMQVCPPSYLLQGVVQRKKEKDLLSYLPLVALQKKKEMLYPFHLFCPLSYPLQEEVLQRKRRMRVYRLSYPLQ